MLPILQIQLLGDFRLIYNGKELTEVSSDRAQALLAYLVLHCNMPQPRSRLACLFWAESTEAQARTNLRRELHHLRQALPNADQFIEVENKTLQWRCDAPFTLDVAEFEQTIAQAEAADRAGARDAVQRSLEQAIARYRGDLLPQCYDEWILPEQERLRQTWLRALAWLVRVLTDQREIRAAMRYAQQLLEADALNETPYQALMQLHALSGDRASALRLYHRCMTMLRDEMGIAPSPATRDLYDRLLNEKDEPAPAPPSAPPSPVLESPVLPRCDWGDAIDISGFHGRTPELTTLKHWTLEQRCRLIALLGMGGIGKTALAVKFAQDLQPAFEGVIWRSLRLAPALETLLGDWIAFLSEQQDATVSLERLLHGLRSRRCLLILDNVETILQEGKSGQFCAGYEGYGDLLRAVGATVHQSCLLLTSREKPAEISLLEGGSDADPTDQRACASLQLGGSIEVAHALMQAKGLIGSDAHRQQLGQIYSHNPLALKMVTTSIQDLFDGEIADFLAQGTPVFNGIYKLLDQQCQRSTRFEQTVMIWLAIHREGITLAELAADLSPTVARVALLEALESLSWRSLLEKQAGRYTQPPIVMEYITDRLIEWVCDEIEELGRDATEPPRSAQSSRLPKPAFPVPLLQSHALLTAEGKDYIREIQIRQIVQPILRQLHDRSGTAQQVEQTLTRLVDRCRRSPLPGYAGGNLINLLIQQQMDLTGYDFSGLALWQADLRHVNLHRVNLAGADLSRTVFTEPLNFALSVAFSPEGRLLATGDTNGDVRVWQVADGKCLLVCQGHTRWVWSIAFSPDRQTLISGSDDTTIKVWDLHSGTCRQTLQGHCHPVWSVAVSSDGHTLASGSEDHTIKLWDLRTGTCWRTLSGHENWVRSIAFSPDGRMLMSGSDDQTIKFWDLETGECWQTQHAHQGQIWSVAFSPDGQTVASSSSDQTIKLWQVQTGECRQVLKGHRNWVRSIAFSPDGTLLASSSEDQTIKFWRVQSGECLQTLRGHGNWVRSIAFSPDGTLLASGSGDHTVKLWQVQTGQCWKTLQGYANRVRSVAFSPDGQCLASGNDDHTIRLWAVRTSASPRAPRTCLRTLSGHRNAVCSVAWRSDGQILASGSSDQTIKLWDVQTGECLKTLAGHSGLVWSVQFSPEGSLIASGSDDKTVKLWDVQTGKCRQTLRGHKSWVCEIAFSPDGETIASGSYDQTIKLWNRHTGQCLQTWQGHSNWVWSVAWSPDGKTLASGSGDQTVRLWDVQTGECRQTLRHHDSRVWSVGFSADGSRLASASSDQTVKVWDVQTGTCLQTLTGHKNLIWSVAFSADGRTLASGSQDETIRLWDSATGHCWQTLIADRPYEGMNIAKATGLTPAQTQVLKLLGAIESDEDCREPRPISPAPPLPPLIGRDREQACLQHWLTATSDILLFLGEPGIGKTRLLAELAAVVSAGSGQVLGGRGFAAETLRPYGAWIDAVRSRSPDAARRLFAEAETQAGRSGDRSQLFDGLVEFLTQQAQQGTPLVVILDDMQWLDAASTALLHYTTRVLSGLPVRFAGAARPAELVSNSPVAQLVQTLRREKRLQTLELGLLNRDQVIQLVRTIDPAINGDRVYRDSGGNPLFALELARAMADHDLDSRETLEALIQDRLQHLAESARAVLPWAALFRCGFSPTWLAQVADCPLMKLLDAVEELEQQGILRPSVTLNNEVGYDFVHEVIRQVADRQLSEPRRRLMHLQIAQALNAIAPAAPELASDVAHHAALGGDHGLAAAAALTAADRSLRLFAYSEASELAQRGIQSCQRLTPDRQVRLHIRLLKVYVLAGVTNAQVSAIAATLRHLIAEVNRLQLQEEEAIGWEALIALNYDHGNLANVHEHSLRVAERGRSASPATTARMLAYSGWCLAEIEREMPRAEALLLEAQTLAARVGLNIIDIPCGLGCVRRYAADFEAARSLLEQAWHMAEAAQDHWRECACLMYLAMTELEAGQPTAAIGHCQALASVARQMGDEGSELAFAEALTALVHYRLDPISAESALETALATLRQLDANRMLAYTLTLAAETDLQQQQVERAIARTEAARQAATIVEHASELALAWAVRIQAECAIGNRQQAIEWLEDLPQQLDSRTLSARARAALEQLNQTLRP